VTSEVPQQFPDEDLPGGGHIDPEHYPSAIEPESIDPDFPSSPGAPAAPDAPQTDPDPQLPDPEVDPTPDEPTIPSPDVPAEPAASGDGEVPVEPPAFDPDNPNPPTESFFGRSIN
jgi:fibronectin-binding protein B